MRTVQVGIALLLVLPMWPALATQGLFSHGYGIKSQGAGGIAVALAEDSGALAANSAGALQLDSRYDVGLDWIYVTAGATLRDNAAGPDQHFDSDGQRHFPIPQGGFVRRLGPDSAVGVTLFSAGFGTNYPQNPYARFGSSSPGGIELMQSVISTSFAYALTPTQHLGIGLNLAYQQLKVRGLNALAPYSQAPQQLSDNGADGSFGYSLQLGWRGQLTPWLDAGLAWRSRTDLGHLRDYAGLLPQGGQFDLPSTYAAGLAWRPDAAWTLGIDLQRVNYASEAATGNSIAQLAQGQALGAEHGPGFGWLDQTIYKIGLRWQASDAWTLRAGYVYASNLIPHSETLFGAMAQAVMRHHYTVGATRVLENGWEWSAYAAHAPRTRVEGRDSIPAAFGGGESDVDAEQLLMGFSFARSFR